MKEINIKINSSIEFETLTLVNPDHWEQATDEQRREYVHEQIKQHIEENMDEIIYLLMDNSTIIY
jgi:hypothetical protein